MTRVMAAEAASFVRCAGRPRLPLLLRVVDGRPNTGETRNALHQHIMRNRACFQDFPSLPPNPDAPHYGSCNPRVANQTYSICRTDYDRGFIYEQALRDYAPDLRLSRSNTFDHATMARFRAREEVRNNAPLRPRHRFFYTAACMAQIRPRYALALLQEAPGSDNETRLRAKLISDGAPCVGGVSVERVLVVPGQFRAYLVEAVYSWAVAVKRTDSLLSAAATG